MKMESEMNVVISGLSELTTYSSCPSFLGLSLVGAIIQPLANLPWMLRCLFKVGDGVGCLLKLLMMYLLEIDKKTAIVHGHETTENNKLQRCDMTSGPFVR